MQKTNLAHHIKGFKDKNIQSEVKYLDQNEKSKLVILISGREGRGKTHLASTISAQEQVFLIDTEYRALIVTRKFSNIKVIQAKNYNELKNAVQFIVNNESNGTIIIDSASDLQIFAEIEYLNQTLKDKVGMPWNWSNVWKLCNDIIDLIKYSKKFNLVLTSRVKEEYLNDKPTGNSVPRIYSTLPYKADIMLQFSDDTKPKLIVTKNGFTNQKTESLNTELNLPQIINLLISKNHINHIKGEKS